MKKKIICIVVIFVLLLGTGSVLASSLLTRTLSGTMQYQDIEGGFWVVISNGKSYIPINLTEKYMVEGLEVKFQVVDLSDLAGIHMHGSYVEILE